MSYTKPVFTHGDNCVQVESALFAAANTDPLQTVASTQELLPGDYELWVLIVSDTGNIKPYQLAKRNAADSADVWLARGYFASTTVTLYFPRVSVTGQERFRVRATPSGVGHQIAVTFSYRQVTDRTRGEPDYYGGAT